MESELAQGIGSEALTTPSLPKAQFSSGDESATSRRSLLRGTGRTNYASSAVGLRHDIPTVPLNSIPPSVPLEQFTRQQDKGGRSRGPPSVAGSHVSHQSAWDDDDGDGSTAPTRNARKGYAESIVSEMDD